jgi:hypothetical protein
MKNLLFSLIFLSTTALSHEGFRYAGPYVTDAIKSSLGIIEMSVPIRVDTAIVLNGCDSINKVDRNPSYTNLSYSKDDKSIIITLKNLKFGEVTAVNIMTEKGLTHTLALTPAPKDYQSSQINLKVIIEDKLCN